ncbi:MAG TPA: hypothetical protein PKU77_04085 [Ferruginibacter sp.]|nr:hypothetical protein [Ferruginibacter sp.]
MVSWLFDSLLDHSLLVDSLLDHSLLDHSWLAYGLKNQLTMDQKNNYPWTND